MTELERARKHLGNEQCLLSFLREQGRDKSEDHGPVLAALSWLWDAQVRATLAEARERGGITLRFG